MITDGVDGFLLQDPKDAAELSRRITQTLRESGISHGYGKKAAIAARKYDWERNAQQVREFLEHARTRKRAIKTRCTLAQNGTRHNGPNTNAGRASRQTIMLSCKL